ncbi:MAG: hypothetical protein QMD43_03095 [Thermodesulfovibrio sp.]|nr:hypothetical protein [Thermodesulfovibrio sp.]
MAITISQTFSEFKSRLEFSESFQKKITTHYNAIREWIEINDPKIETKLIGSLQRKTRIQPRSNDTFDIDILVILGSFERWVAIGGITPQDALDKVEDIILEHETYDKMGPETDSPAIIIKYKDNTKVELVPAYIDNIGYYPNGMPIPPKGRGYWIPKRNTWELADYDYDAEYISKKNKETDGYLIPTIKMLKAAKRNLFPIMKSYHLEVLAVNIIPKIVSYLKNNKHQISYPLLVCGFFLMAKDEIIKPAKILGSKSPNADKYLDNSRKIELKSYFEKLSNYCQELISLDGKEAIEGWRELFGEPFPAYG